MRRLRPARNAHRRTLHCNVDEDLRQVTDGPIGHVLLLFDVRDRPRQGAFSGGSAAGQALALWHSRGHRFPAAEPIPNTPAVQAASYCEIGLCVQGRW